jgi:hypothetical protein
MRVLASRALLRQDEIPTTFDSVENPVLRSSAPTRACVPFRVIVWQHGSAHDDSVGQLNDFGSREDLADVRADGGFNGVMICWHSGPSIWVNNSTSKCGDARQTQQTQAAVSAYHEFAKCKSIATVRRRLRLA